MREFAARLVAWIYEIRTITGPNFGTYFVPKNDFILEALPRAGARVSPVSYTHLTLPTILLV